MAHEVESMFYVNKEIDKLTGEVSRFVPWHGLGTPIEEACSSAEALELAGLDWEVNSRPIYTDNGIQIPGYIANTRSSDNKVLGVVTSLNETTAVILMLKENPPLCYEENVEPDRIEMKG